MHLTLWGILEGFAADTEFRSYVRGICHCHQVKLHSFYRQTTTDDRH